MTKTGLGLVGGTGLMFLVGCASTPVVLDSVGPAPSGPVTAGSLGCLRVFTAVETRELGENTYYYAHTGYSIYTASGKLWKYIPNHTSEVDENPAWVTLPAGKYIVKAEANFDVWGTVAYPVTVPVVIGADQTTEIHLEADWKAPASASTNKLVYLPGGKPVGWKPLTTD